MVLSDHIQKNFQFNHGTDLFQAWQLILNFKLIWVFFSRILFFALSFGMVRVEVQKF